VDFKYIVHGVTPGQRPEMVMIDGKEEQVSRKYLEVELTSDVPARHGSLILRFIGSEQDEAKDVFKEGEEVTLSIGGSEPTE
jgi:hypothetical protein